MKVKSESEVAQSCPTLNDPMNCSLPGSFVHGIFQARVLEWVAIAFSELGGLNGVNIYIKFYVLLLALFITSLRNVVGEGSGIPFQYSCLENPMNGGAW